MDLPDVLSKNHIRLGDEPVAPNELRENGKGIGNLPGYNRSYQDDVHDNSDTIGDKETPGEIVGE